MSGAQNAIIGDNDSATNIPETVVPEELLTEEKKMAKYSQSAEFKRLKDFMENRVKFYQRYLPNGSRVEGDPLRVGMPQGLPASDLASYWVASCIVIKELENILSEYDQAREAVKSARSENT